MDAAPVGDGRTVSDTVLENLGVADETDGAFVTTLSSCDLGLYTIDSVGQLERFIFSIRSLEPSNTNNN